MWRKVNIFWGAVAVDARRDHDHELEASARGGRCCCSPEGLVAELAGVGQAGAPLLLPGAQVTAAVAVLGGRGHVLAGRRRGHPVETGRVVFAI